MRQRTLTLIWSRRGWFGILSWAVWCMALAGAAHAYGQKPDAQKLEESVKQVQRWQLNQRRP